MIKLRYEKPGDEFEIENLNKTAFGGDSEANIVNALRKNSSEYFSIVAEIENKIAGHILFTPVIIENPECEIKGMGLAPMSVHPDYQRRGVGYRLIEKGLEIIRSNDYPFVVVLGHPEYYPKFGFEKASTYNVKCEYEGVPDEAFMIIILDKKQKDKIHGLANYRPEFNEF